MLQQTYPANTDLFSALAEDIPRIRIHVLLDPDVSNDRSTAPDALATMFAKLDTEDSIDLPYTVYNLNDVVDEYITESEAAATPYVLDAEGNVVPVDPAQHKPDSMYLDPEIISISEMFTVAKRYYPPTMDVLAAFMDFHNADGITQGYAPGTYRIQRKVYANDVEPYDREDVLEQLHHTLPYSEHWHVSDTTTSPVLYGWPNHQQWVDRIVKPYALPHGWIDTDGSYQSLFDYSSGRIIPDHISYYVDVVQEHLKQHALLAVVDLYV